MPVCFWHSIVKADGVVGLFRGAGPTVTRAMSLNMGMLASNDQVLIPPTLLLPSLARASWPCVFCSRTIRFHGSGGTRCLLSHPSARVRHLLRPNSTRVAHVMTPAPSHCLLCSEGGPCRALPLCLHARRALGATGASHCIRARCYHLAPARASLMPSWWLSFPPRSSAPGCSCGRTDS